MKPGAVHKFDPYRILQTLDRHRVNYIVVGGFARIIQGTEELTDGLDIVPSTRDENLTRLDSALQELAATRTDGQPLNHAQGFITTEPVTELATSGGELKIIPEPAGTRGYDDLRRAANREPLGHGTRPAVASIGDLARMLSAHGQQQQLPQLHQLRRIVELDRNRGRTLQR